MKKMKFWSIVLLMALSLPLFNSCGSDDEESSNTGTGPTVNGKKLMGYTLRKGTAEYVTTFEYNSKGQIIVETEKSNTGLSNVIYYTYEDDKIKVRSNNNSTIYGLSNGLIVSASYEYNNYSFNYSFVYDNNGYLTSTSRTDGSSISTTNFTWVNGNLVKDGDITITYSRYSSSMLPLLARVGDNRVLSMQGYFGKLCSNLPSQEVDSDGTKYSYDYTIENGVVTKFVLDAEHIYTYNWE